MNGIILKGFDAPTLAEDFLVLRSNIIAKASKIKSVGSLPSEEIAVEALTELQKLERVIEKCRKEVKDRPFQLCKQIDSLAAEAVEPIETQAIRVKKLLGNYAEIKRQEALEEENKRQEEIRKIQEAQRLEEEKARRAAEEQARAEQEAIRLAEVAARSKSDKARAEAQFAIEKARAIADHQARMLAEASQAIQRKEDEMRDSLPVTITKATGASTKFVLKYEVLDINELFANYPHVCEITEKKSAVNMLINGLAMANNQEIPKVKGLRVWREADINTRSK